MAKNIAEIILLQNNNKKITKINAICSKVDKYHNSIIFNSNKYDFGICKNCHNIMHNSCKSKNYCVLCIAKNLEECEKCNKYTTHILRNICYRCDGIIANECAKCARFILEEHKLDCYSNIICAICLDES